MTEILIVDDDNPLRVLIGEVLNADGYNCTLAADASQARRFLKARSFELVLCDISMPGESGLDFIRFATAEYPDTAAVMVTAMDDPMIAEIALEIGVYDYIIKPFDPNGVLISVNNALRRRQLEIDNRIYHENLEKMVAERTTALQESEARLRAIFEAAEHVSFIMVDHSGENAAIVEFSPGAEHITGYSREEVMGQPVAVLHLPEDAIRFPEVADLFNKAEPESPRELTLTRKSGEKLPVLFSTYPIFNTQGDVTATLLVSVDISERKKTEKKLKDSMERWQKALEGSIRAMALIVEMRDPYTAGHQQRVADLAAAVAEELGLSDDRIYATRMAGIIHDIGKLSVPTEILIKPGFINEIEFNLIKMHPKVGYEILKTIEFPWPIALIVLQHHERMDGSGYPSGLSGEEILLEARILSVADIVEATASHRPYRPALGLDKALEEISKNKGTLYDSQVVDAILKVFKEKGFKFDPPSPNPVIY